MHYSAMQTANKNMSAALTDEIREITRTILRCLMDKKAVALSPVWKFLKEYPNYDCNQVFDCNGTKLQIIQLAVLTNDISLCNYLIEEKGAKPTSNSVNVACRNGYNEIVALLLSHYVEPSNKDIALWKQTAILNGHNEIAYLIVRLLNPLFIQFSKSDSDYFINAINAAIKYSPLPSYVDAPTCKREKKVVLQEMLDQLTLNGYINYTIEYLTVLRKAVHDYISLNKLFHLGAEDKINKAINRYSQYKDGSIKTNERTNTGALLVTIE